MFKWNVWSLTGFTSLQTSLSVTEFLSLYSAWGATLLTQALVFSRMMYVLSKFGKAWLDKKCWHITLRSRAVHGVIVLTPSLFLNTNKKRLCVLRFSRLQVNIFCVSPRPQPQREQFLTAKLWLKIWWLALYKARTHQQGVSVFVKISACLGPFVWHSQSK